jgi:peptidoglycan/xylan/chitin deacetylase (PgdA/CDA1 family)
VRWGDLAARAAATRAADLVVGALERAHRGAPGTLAVLTYHRVDEPEARPELQPSLVSATPAAFRAQMEAVATRWRPVSIHDVLAAKHGTASLPRRAVLVTLDDAYEDAEAHAWPILASVGVPGLLFVPTGFPDDPTRTFWWDDLHDALRTTPMTRIASSPIGPLELGSPAMRKDAFRRLRAWFKATPHHVAVQELDELLASLDAEPRRPAPVLGWERLRQLAAEGLSLAAHSVSHAMLDRLGDGRAAIVDEVASSRRQLASETGCDLPVFAYPSGQHDDDVVAATAEAGIEVAFTTRRGHVRVGLDDWLRLRRINVSARTPTPAVRAQLLPSVSRAVQRYLG